MIAWLSSAEIASYRPSYTLRDARQLIRKFYGFDSNLTPLPSDRDQNFRVRSAADREFVLKLVSGISSTERLSFEIDVIAHLEGRIGDVVLPEIVRTTDGNQVFETDDSVRGYLVRWIDGKPMGDARPHTRSLLAKVGRTTALLDVALADLGGDVELVSTPWDLMQAHQVVDALIGEVQDEDGIDNVRYFREQFRERAEPLLDLLPAQVVHGDLNDYNLLVNVSRRGLRLTGILDWGDSHRSARVVDPVIAAAYAALHWVDPVGAAAAVGGAYNDIIPLTEQELRVFMPLLAMRLCASVCISSSRQREEPNDKYITISQASAWETLERLRSDSLDLAYFRLRAACGLEPCPESTNVTAWIEGHRDKIAPVCGYDLSTTPTLLLDLSVSSAAPYVLADEPLATKEIEIVLNNAGAQVAIGRYDEVRLAYSNSLFEIPTLDGPAQRTVHIGADVFLPPGAEVRAALAGEIFGFADNAQHLSYGPTIILRHEPNGCPAFFTLYGHLSRSDLDNLEIGRPVDAGETIGHIGDSTENGGWTAHLHFQVIVDMLDCRTDFPGVCAFQDRAAWTSLCPSPYGLLGLSLPTDSNLEPEPNRLLEKRASLIAPALSFSYDEPLLILRASGSYMYDHAGRTYLDCVNNVNHVGHCHPAVSKAVSDQMRVLNTNTRYLHPTILEYARRLTAALPAPLSVCFFVNSGSEANDLALRLARTHTGRTATVVLDAAYHGHLTSLIDISPYKFAGPGGAGPGHGVFVASLPDTYRGLYRDETASERYAKIVGEKLSLADAQGGAATFICESLLSCGGQIELPPRFLEKVYSLARTHGAVCIADEVQVGFGRVGTHFWGFETQGVVPDIVTMGKPIGNGHPLAAVVTTPEIAASFNTGMEYFNTYGGNPVSCAAGLAVLETVEQEGLQSKALEVGAYLKEGLTDLRNRFPLVGDVRGRGLFIGVELVTDPEDRTPATEHAEYVINRARALGVLLSTDGPDHNVLKIKPPLVFGRSDADRLLQTLEQIFLEDPAQP